LLSSWRFWLPLALQVILVLALPAQAIYTHLTGQTIVLQVAPVDPYDILRGYSVTLNYDISRPSLLETLPGWDEVADTSADSDAGQDRGTPYYVILEAPAQTGGEPPAPWTAVAVSQDRPTDLPANQVALEATGTRGMVTYGLERYYVPEDQISQINDQIFQLQRNNPGTDPDNLPPIVLEAKVDDGGNAVPLALWLGDRRYRF
jgi:uncharacterized membrane-anchored protein